jgi:hypothetical protein
MLDADLTANFFDILRINAIEQPDRPAIDDGDLIISYQELDKLIDRGAGNLRMAGITTGEVVALKLGNNAIPLRHNRPSWRGFVFNRFEHDSGGNQQWPKKCQRQDIDNRRRNRQLN